jgi:hypothetical protein
VVWYLAGRGPSCAAMMGGLEVAGRAVRIRSRGSRQG